MDQHQHVVDMCFVYDLLINNDYNNTCDITFYFIRVLNAFNDYVHIPCIYITTSYLQERSLLFGKLEYPHENNR